jgi:tripartite-type tricarboxylate transporter receptor subunit TctC
MRMTIFGDKRGWGFARTAAAFSILFSAAVATGSAVAQGSDPAANFPNKPIRLIVGFAAGGGTDIFARIVAQKLYQGSGQPVVVENRVGAASIIATEYVARQPADGYTLLLVPITTMSVNPAVYTNIPYSPLRDFAPISLLASYPYMLVVNKTVAVNSLPDLITFAKANPQKANTAGASAGLQLVNELFKMTTGVPMEYIGYKSTTESVSAVISGEVLMTLSDSSPLSGPIRNGQVTALAVTSSNRMDSFPEVPTMRELGFKDLEMLSWNGVWAPAGTPPAIVASLQNELIRIVKLPDVRERFAGLAADPVGSTSEEFRKIIESELARWTAVAKAGNIKITP